MIQNRFIFKTKIRLLFRVFPTYLEKPLLQTLEMAFFFGGGGDICRKMRNVMLNIVFFLFFGKIFRQLYIIFAEKLYVFIIWPITTKATSNSVKA